LKSWSALTLLEYMKKYTKDANGLCIPKNKTTINTNRKIGDLYEMYHDREDKMLYLMVLSSNPFGGSFFNFWQSDNNFFVLHSIHYINYHLPSSEFILGVLKVRHHLGVDKLYVEICRLTIQYSFLNKHPQVLHVSVNYCGFIVITLFFSFVPLFFQLFYCFIEQIFFLKFTLFVIHFNITKIRIFNRAMLYPHAISFIFVLLLLTLLWLVQFADNDGHRRAHERLKVIWINIDNCEHPQEWPNHDPDCFKQLV